MDSENVATALTALSTAVPVPAWWEHSRPLQNKLSPALGSCDMVSEDSSTVQMAQRPNFRKCEGTQARAQKGPPSVHFLCSACALVSPNPLVGGLAWGGQRPGGFWVGTYV